MTADQLNAILGICVPLLIAQLAYLGALARSWLMAHINAIGDARLRDACLTAAQAFKHTLNANVLLTSQHETAIVGIVHALLPNVPTADITTGVQAAAHAVNEASKAVWAQQTAAANQAPVAAVVPAIDYAALAGTLVQTLAAGVQQPPTDPPPAPAPVPLVPSPAPSTGSATATAAYPAQTPTVTAAGVQVGG